MILLSKNPTVRDFAYVQDMRRLSPPCWNPLCGNVAHSRFPTLLLTPAVGISAPARRRVSVYKCTHGDTRLGQVHPPTHLSLSYQDSSYKSSVSQLDPRFSVSHSSPACPALVFVSGQSRGLQAGVSSHGRT